MLFCCTAARIIAFNVSELLFMRNRKELQLFCVRANLHLEPLKTSTFANFKIKTLEIVNSN